MPGAGRPRPNVRALPKVAAEATIREVVAGRYAAVLPAYNVVNLVWRIGVMLVQQTVFTAEPGTLGDERP
jgi:hypothetical protein